MEEVVAEEVEVEDPELVATSAMNRVIYLEIAPKLAVEIDGNRLSSDI